MDYSHKPNLKIGIITAILAALFLSTMNMMTKIMSDDLNPLVIAFWRNSFAFIILLSGFILTKKMHLMRTKRIGSHIIRSVIGTIGFLFGIWMFSLMPITEGTIIGFTSPLFVVILSYPLLKEKVGIYRVIATLVGLAGVIFIIGFNHSQITSTGYIVGLSFALSNGLVLIMLRQLGKTEHAMTTVFYFMLIGLIITSFGLPFSEKIIPDQSLWWMVVALGIVGIISLLFKTESYRHAPASVITPLVYTMLLWSAFFDYLIWNHVGSADIWIGASIVIASNLFILWRENKKSKTDANHST